MFLELIFRSRCRHSCSLQFRGGRIADNNYFGHTFLFHSIYRYREMLCSNYFCCDFGQTVFRGSVNRRKPKGTAGRGREKKPHYNLRQTFWLKLCGSGVSGRTALPTSSQGAAAAPRGNPLREVGNSSPSLRIAWRQLPSPRGRHCLPCAEVRDPLREVVRGQPSHHYFEVVLSQLLREDVC